MVRAYHAIFTTYGFWLPNDPRGTWSDFVRRWDLFRFGPAATTTERRSLAHVSHDRRQREAAKKALLYPEVHFDGQQALACIRGFDNAIQRSGYVLFACSILPQHVHVVVARHQQKIEQIVGQLKGEATKQLELEGRHPMAAVEVKAGKERPSPWGRRCWKVFLNSDADILRAIRYVEENPIKEGKRRQSWSIVTPFGD